MERAGLSVATRRLTHAVLHRALRDAVRWGRLARNPADMADPPSRGRTRAQAWTAAELRRFLDHVADDRLYALWRLAATTGMRRGELAGLTWRALDLDGARLAVEQQLVPTRGGATLGPPKSSRSRRTVALDADTVTALREHRDGQLVERALAGDGYDDRDFVFADALGSPTHPQRLTEWFGERRRAAGIPTGSLHILRHTSATIALTAGVPIHIVAARLGDDAKTVLSTYAHLLPQSDELAAQRVAAALTAGCVTLPGPFSLPDLSNLDDKLTANYMLSMLVGRGFPPGDTQFLVAAFVRSTEGALRRYEAARLLLERSAKRDSIVDYVRGCDDMELAFMALHRTMRLAEGLMKSPKTAVGKKQLPSEADRDLLRVVRNAIDHVDQPIIGGRAGKGQTIQLRVEDDASNITDDADDHEVSHAQLGEWMRTLHKLAVDLTNTPQDWIR